MTIQEQIDRLTNELMALHHMIAALQNEIEQIKSRIG
jgi:prefoldin subunit 5